MITLEPIDGPAYIFRVCPVDDGSGSPPFVASGFLSINGSTGTIKAFRGDMTAALMREVLGKLRELGLSELLAKRTDGHGLPFSVLRPDGYLSCDLVALEKRFLKQQGST